MTQPPPQRGPAAWNALLPNAAPAQQLEGKQTADFVVVGGGFAGLSALRRLQQIAPNAKLALIEAGRLAESTAGRNSGFMVDLPHELTSETYEGLGDDAGQTLLNRQAIAFARAAVEEYGMPASAFDPSGKVNGAASERALGLNQRYAEHLDSLGEPYELLDAQAMHQLTGSRHYLGGLYTPGTVLLQPAAYIRGLAEGLSAAGAHIYEDSPLLKLKRQGQDWHVTTPRGSVSSPHLILAVNGLVERFGYAKGRLLHLFLFGSMTPQLDGAQLASLGGAETWGLTPSDPMGTSVRRFADRILIRSYAVLRSHMRVSSRDLIRARHNHGRKLAQRFPSLAGLAPEYSWSGQLCLSLNGVSLVDELEPGLFSACVQNGLGTTRGTLSGMAAAEMAAGETSAIRTHFANETLPSRLPPRPFLDWGANSVLAWRSWRARAE